MKNIYENKINGFGHMANTFLSDGIFILFGNDAPDTLKDYCYTIDILPANDEIRKGQVVEIDNQTYTITAVGNIAQRNLESLGHVTVAFSGDEEASMPGTIVVEKAEVPTIKVGTTIRIVSHS